MTTTTALDTPKLGFTGLLMNYIKFKLECKGFTVSLRIYSDMANLARGWLNMITFHTSKSISYGNNKIEQDQSHLPTGMIIINADYLEYHINQPFLAEPAKGDPTYKPPIFVNNRRIVGQCELDDLRTNMPKTIKIQRPISRWELADPSTDIDKIIEHISEVQATVERTYVDQTFVA